MKREVNVLTTRERSCLGSYPGAIQTVLTSFGWTVATTAQQDESLSKFILFNLPPLSVYVCILKVVHLVHHVLSYSHLPHLLPYPVGGGMVRESNKKSIMLKSEPL